MVYIENDVKRVLLFSRFLFWLVLKKNLLKKKSSMHSFLSDVCIDKRYFFQKYLGKKESSPIWDHFDEKSRMRFFLKTLLSQKKPQKITSENLHPFFLKFWFFILFWSILGQLIWFFLWNFKKKVPLNFEDLEKRINLKQFFLGNRKVLFREKSFFLSMHLTVSFCS